MSTKHTQTPWKVTQDNGIVAADGQSVACVSSHIRRDWDVKKANAAHIVRCVNSHDDLLAALKELGNQLQARVESAGHVIWGPSDVRAAENGEPAWVCNARGALAQARAAIAAAESN